MEYEICSDPFDPRYVRATFLYPPGTEPEKAKLLLEQIRGKEKDMIHKYTPEKEFDLINDQLKKSQIDHEFCRPKPARQVESDKGSKKVLKGSKKVLKKPRIQKNKRG
ncbi:hypothetical protein AALP_AA6G319800 [Arabis alpina]|uniref:Uncharacterized protein n=1 Tax=Arabis alpina TaxID=50452 RepID=A0A087GT16_ARAAL|nr:hypothetical protein AALP_AA6G319800 [Arabis alpina]